MTGLARGDFDHSPGMLTVSRFTVVTMQFNSLTLGHAQLHVIAKYVPRQCEKLCHFHAELEML